MESFNPLWIVAGLGAVTLLIGVVTFIFQAGGWYKNVNSDRNRFNEFMEEVRQDIKKILLRLPSPVATKSSPIRLTDLGEAISDGVNAKGIVNEIADEIIEQARGKTKYQIQELCQDYFKNKYEPDHDTLSVMEMCAFENGVKLEEVRTVLSIELRDRVFELLPD